MSNTKEKIEKSFRENFYSEETNSFGAGRFRVAMNSNYLKSEDCYHYAMRLEVFSQESLRNYRYGITAEEALKIGQKLIEFAEIAFENRKKSAEYDDASANVGFRRVSPNHTY